MIHIQLTERQRQELTAVSRQAVGRVALRAHMVLLSDRGYSVAVIALMHACGCDVVRTLLHLLPLVGAGWMKGPRVRIPPPATTARHAFFGALDAVSGRWLWTDHDRKLAIHFVAFLEQVVTAYPTGVLYLALDGAPAHTAKVVERWLSTHPRVIALRLPTYAAHRDNPAERIWGLMKDAVAANRLDGSIADLVRAARRFFTELAPHPVQLPLAA